jgi:bifunctional pyridoxal-dependent enzyme with beta-cystathionase and maltose regulon repressor activities
MIRSPLIATILMLVASTNAFGGFYSSSYDSRGTVVASVEIEDKGIYNLVVSIQFLNKPYDKREYESDSYEELINRLSIEWRGVALKKILESNTYKVSDLKTLEASVESEVHKLIKLSKKKHGLSQGIEVIFSISSFYLIEPSDN